MIYQYTELVIQAFRSEPESMEINGWIVNYLSFSLPKNAEKTPLVLIGGAFQQFHSFLSDLKAYLPQVPVILVALPGQGSNRDTQDSSQLSLKDMADMLEILFANLGLQSIDMAGFSYGSLLAYTYAYHYEARLEHLMLVGCSLELRHVQKQLLAYSIDHFGTASKEECSETIAQTLFNMNAREQTGLSMNLVEKLTTSFRNLSVKEMQDYQTNSARLLREKVTPRTFGVRALVVSAQHDHFILPHESLEVHSLFTRGDFVLIEKGDHLIPLQSPRLIYKTILEFLSGMTYSSEGILQGLAAIEKARERRKQPRHRIEGLAVTMFNSNGYRFEGKLDDISLDGCGMTLPKAMGVSAEFSGTWILDIGASGLEIPGFLRVNGGKASFVFLKRTFQSWKIMSEFVSSLHDIPSDFVRI